jgi:membrane protease YdiL (CAAX protease family)
LENPLTTVPTPPEPPPAPARPRGHPLVRSALYLAVYFLTQIAVGLALGALAFALGDRFLREEGFLRSAELLLLAVVCQAPLVLGATWLFVHFLDRRSLASLGARWPKGGRKAAFRQVFTVPLGVLALLGGWLLLILVLPRDLAALHFDGVSAAYSAGGPSWWPLPPVFLLGALLALFRIQGGIEEWIVRGYIYRALKERWRPWWAALASSVLFSLLHANNPNVSVFALINIILAGLVLAAMVERSGSLWSVTLAHGFWNFTISCLLSLPVSGIATFHLLDVSVTGDERLTGGSFGPEGSGLMTLLGLALSTGLWWRLREERTRKRITPSAPEDVPGDALL